jgi:hypothetical protein
MLDHGRVGHLEGEVELLENGSVPARFHRDDTFALEEVIGLLGLQLGHVACSVRDVLQDLSSVQKLRLDHEPEANLINDSHVLTSF